MNNNDEMIKKLEKLDEKHKHEISPYDLENNDFVQIRLNNRDAHNLKELLSFILNQLERH